MNSLTLTIIYSVIAGSATFVGLLLVLWFKDWTKKHSIYIISAAAGVLMTTAFFHLMPEAIELAQDAVNIFSSPYFFVLLGFMVLYIVEQIIVIHACAEEDCGSHSFGIISAIGIGIHSLMDGIVIGVGFEVSNTIGILTAMAVILHELPEGIFTFGILVHSHLSTRKSIIYTSLVALATPVGAIASFFLIKSINLIFLGDMLAFAAGTFIYIAASDLIPQTHKVSRKANIPFVLAGSVFIIILATLLEH